MNRAMAQEAWAKARARAEELYSIMVEKGIVAPASAADYDPVELVLSDGTKQIVLVPKTDEAKADVALKETYGDGLGPMGTQQTKLGALNTVSNSRSRRPRRSSKSARRKTCWRQQSRT
jgi:hypothetical protein